MSITEPVQLTIDDIKAKLLPCPFCGSDSAALQNTWTPAYWVECLDCDARKPGEAADWQINSQAYDRKRHIKSAKSAVEAWNTRFAA